MRAAEPTHEGDVVRDGVRTHYDVYGDAERTIVLLPTWSLFHARHWGAQIAYLARKFRVITIDGRGNGRSDRPRGPDAYSDEMFVGDVIAVLDATATTRAVVAGVSYGGHLAALLAALHPDRIAGAVLIQAIPLARRRIPALRAIVVAGPRIDPTRLPTADGVELRGYVPDLPRHLACCDLGVVQGGLTTCMELAAAGTFFLYVPLAHHFEQCFHVDHRLRRFGAGRRIDHAATTPEALAAAIVEELGRPARRAAVDPGSAARAAALLAEML